MSFPDRQQVQTPAIKDLWILEAGGVFGQKMENYIFFTLMWPKSSSAPELFFQDFASCAVLYWDRRKMEGRWWHLFHI